MNTSYQQIPRATRSRENSRSSRFPGLYELEPDERVEQLVDRGWLSSVEARQLLAGEPSLTVDIADRMVENAVGAFRLPLSIAPNFKINGRDYLVPMAIEEPSVVAAVSNSAKIIRRSGGFSCDTTDPVMSAQVQVVECSNWDKTKQRLRERKRFLIDLANEAEPGMRERGGGAFELDIRELGESETEMLSIDIAVDVRDAMGANVLNSMAEAISSDLQKWIDGKVVVSVLSNLSDRRRVRATCSIPFDNIPCGDFESQEVAERMAYASRFAELDPYRASTHNKGIMNGIDAVCIATGNDWRAIEAGAHAECGRGNGYGPMATWRVGKNELEGKLDLPMSAGTVGGPIGLHPTVQLAHSLLGVESSRELAEILGSVGLAQNFGALRALVVEGIQQGHMALHARTVASTAGASKSELPEVVERLIDSGNIKVKQAEMILEEIRNER